MILQALNKYYEHLVKAGKLEEPGWQPVKVAYALQIDDGGKLLAVLSLMHEEVQKKKQVSVPSVHNVPAQEKRASNIAPNFLCENASYFLGIDNKGKQERSIKCFQACGKLHQSILSDVDSPAARAVVRFFQTWNPALARENEVLKPFLSDVLAGVNLVFDYQGSFVLDDQAIRQRWNAHYQSRTSDGKPMRCLVTGTYGPVARLHPSIKGVAGGQSTGTSLVSFNAPAFTSFGRDDGQGYNAPVSERAAFAYVAALNALIANRSCSMRLGDMTLVFWAEHGEDAYARGFRGMMGEDESLTDDDLHHMLTQLAEGRKVDLEQVALYPDERFYILGLAPNAARLSVRFFLQDQFGAFAENLRQHHERLSIVKPNYEERAYLSLRALLRETVNPNAKAPSPSSVLSAALARAVLTGVPYPAMLLEQTEMRIRADHAISYGKAAIIKAYLLRNTEQLPLYEQYKEALHMELNDQATYPPYLLGRLFATLEGLQQEANPGINATIRDRYFNSACSTPAVVFPQLIKLAQAHLKKVSTGREIHYNKQIGEILSRLDQAYPSRLSLYDQGIFQLGYYHQTQKRYTKKEEKENV